jgi:hypothetical protein
MIHLFWILFWAALSALVVAAGLRAKVRRRALPRGRGPRLDDDAIRTIVATGSLLTVPDDEEGDGPLDLEEIEEEEERFWSESWDEPEEL